MHLEDYDNVSRETQALAVVILRGMLPQEREFPFNPFAKAFKIANKAEIGYYMDLAFRRLDYEAK